MRTHTARPHRVASWLIAATLLAGSPITNSAVTIQPTTPTTYIGHEIIDLAQMEQMRGGFSFAGMEVKFGATLSTLIDNIKLETVFNVTSAGAEIVSQMVSDLASINESIAAIAQNIATQKSELVTGPVAGVTLATGTPSASQPTVPAQQPTTAPSPAQTALANSPHSTAAPVVNNPITSTPPSQPSIATATAGTSPSATVQTPTTTVQARQPAGSLTTAATSSAQQPVAQVAATNIVTTPSPTTPAATTTSQPAETTQANGSSAVLVGQGNETPLAELTPVNVDLSGLSDDNGFSGIVVSNNKGFTAALHKLTQDAAISAVISNASEVIVSQKLEIKIDIANTKSARQASMRAALSKATAGIFR